MRRGITIVGVGLTVLAAGTWLLRLQDPPEPVYQGRTLTSWLDERAQASRTGIMNAFAAPDGAVRALGPKAIPTLLAWISKRGTWLSETAEKLQRGFGLPAMVRRSQNRKRAVQGFSALGPAAQPAYSRLIEIALHSGDFGQRQDAIDALRSGDVETMRRLAAGLKNPDRAVRLHAIEALGLPIAPGEVSIPALEEALSDPDAPVRAEATAMLAIVNKNLENWAACVTGNHPIIRTTGILHISSYGTRARAYLPLLEAASRDPDPQVRQVATAAILRVRGPHPP